MDNVVDLIATDSSAADTTEKIKDMRGTQWRIKLLF